MRNKILLVLLVIGVFVMGILSVRAYDQYQVQQKIQDEISKSELRGRQAAIEKAEALRAEKEAAEKQRVLDTCLSTLKSYNSLPVSQQAKTVKPDCTLEQVQ